MLLAVRAPSQPARRRGPVRRARRSAKERESRSRRRRRRAAGAPAGAASASPSSAQARRGTESTLDPPDHRRIMTKAPRRRERIRGLDAGRPPRMQAAALPRLELLALPLHAGLPLCTDDRQQGVLVAAAFGVALGAARPARARHGVGRAAASALACADEAVAGQHTPPAQMRLLPSQQIFPQQSSFSQQRLSPQFTFPFGQHFRPSRTRPSSLRSSTRRHSSRDPPCSTRPSSSPGPWGSRSGSGLPGEQCSPFFGSQQSAPHRVVPFGDNRLPTSS